MSQSAVNELNLATLWEINPAHPHNTGTTSHQVGGSQVGGSCTQTSANGDQITQNLPQRPTKRATTTRPFLSQKMQDLGDQEGHWALGVPQVPPRL